MIFQFVLLKNIFKFNRDFLIFSPDLRKILIKECENKKLNFHRSGTMVSIEGPRFSSRAESRMFQQWGAHTIK